MTNTPSEPATRSAPLAEGRRADSARRRQRVLKALNEAATSGDELSVSAIAPQGRSRPHVLLSTS
jgi:hypothetical protein